MPRRRGNPGPNNNNSDVLPVGTGGRGGRGRGRGRGGRGRGRGGPPSNPNLDLNGQQAQPQSQLQQQDRSQPAPPARPLPQTQPQPQSQSQAPSTTPPSGPLLNRGLQTSYTLDLFSDLSLNRDRGKDNTIVFEGNFDDFTLGNSTANRPHPRTQRPSQPQQSSNSPVPVPVHAPQGPIARGRGGPWRGAGWRGRPSVYGAPSLPFAPPFRKGGPHPKNIRGGGLGYAHPVIHSGPSPQYPKRPTTFSKTPRIPLEVLERDRPLLKPVAFVRGEQQTLLFKEKEEILHVPGEEKEHADRVLPSAGIVEEIFHMRSAQAEEAEESNSRSETEDHTDANTPNTIPVETGKIAESNIQATLSLAVDPAIELAVPREEHTSSISFLDEIPVEQQRVSTTVSTEIVMKDEVETTGRGSVPIPSSIPVPITLSLDEANPLPQPETQLFVISTDPTTTDGVDDTDPNTDIQYISTRSQTPLGVASDDEVVYEAPNRQQHPYPSASFKVASTSTPPKAPNNPTLLSTLPSLTLELTPTSVLIQRTIKAQAKSGLKMTPRMRRMVMLGKGAKRRKDSSLFALGLEREERIFESDTNLGKERKGMKERRRHDSDLDWGTEEDDEEESKDAFNASKSKSNDQEQVPDFDSSELDPDIRLKDLLRFVQGAAALSKGNGTGQTIDDLEDGRKMDEEDQDQDEDTGSGMKSTSDTGEDDSEKEDVFDEVERRVIGELDDESSSDSYSSSEGEDFESKLNKLRAENGTDQVKGRRNRNWKKERTGKGKGKQSVVFTSDTESSEDDDADDRFDDIEVVAKADEDERFISEIRDILDENEDLLQSRASSHKNGKKKNRRERGKSKAIFNGSFRQEDSDFDYIDEMDEGLFDISYNSTKRDKSNHLPPSLKARWEQDRAKKAERKRERQLQRELEQMELAVHVSPSGKGKLSKLQKNLLQRSAVDSSSMLTSHVSWDALKFEYASSSTIRVSKITDLSALDSLIRSTFLLSLDIQTIILPPKDKQWRAKAHELCNAFYLKTKSEGREGNRFLAISRTSMTGVGMKEGKINKILRRSGRVERNGGGGWVRDKGKAEGGRGQVKVRTRDGDEVGAAAPKIDSSNIGFKILEKMGWSEGQRIGITGGLADPLTAIIKTTKLGLGATR